MLRGGRGAARAVRVVDDAGDEVALAASGEAHREPRAARDRDAVRRRRRQRGHRGGGAQRLAAGGARAAARRRCGDPRPREHRRAAAGSRGRLAVYGFGRSSRALRAQRLPVFFSNPRTIDGIASDIEKLGTLAGTHDVAAAAAAALRRAARDAQARHRAGRARCASSTRSGISRCTRSAVGISSRRRSQTCGGVNVFASLTAARARREPRGRARGRAGRDRRAVTMPAAARRGSTTGRRGPAIPAVRDGNLFAVDGNLLHRSGPRFVEGVAALCDELDKARQRRRR